MIRWQHTFSFNHHAVTEPWPAFQESQASLIQAIDMAAQLIEAGDLTAQEGWFPHYH